MANVMRQTTCESCGSVLPEQHGVGRRRRYCDATCRSAARRSRAHDRPVDAFVKERLTSNEREGKLDDVSSVQAVSPGGALAAVETALHTVRRAESDLRTAVDRARSAGRSWAEIGETLGTSRQAAFQRFGRPIDPRTGALLAPDLPPGAAEAALDGAVEVIAALAAGRWEAVRRDFDPRLAAALPDAAAVAATWARLAALVGAYEGIGEPWVHRIGELAVVDVPLYFEAGDLVGRIGYRDDGTIAGLWFHRPDAAPDGAGTDRRAAGGTARTPRPRRSDEGD